MPGDYILLTAAKNEAAYIGEALRAVVRQTLLPKAWFIMDDGSTDRTGELIAEFAARYPFIHACSASHGSGKRSFGSKDRAISEAYRKAQGLEFGLVGIHDADIAPQADGYYEAVAREFSANPRLGIAGGYIHERSGNQWLPRKGNADDSVAGGIQMFRRTCYEQIGGYTPLDCGGEDWLAQLDARMAGWEVLALPRHPVLHYRPTSSAGGWWRGGFRLGLMDGAFGSDPAFEFLKCARRLAASPRVTGALLRLSGFCWWKLTRRQALISPAKVEFLRREQRLKLRRTFLRFFIRRGAAQPTSRNLPRAAVSGSPRPSK